MYVIIHLICNKQTLKTEKKSGYLALRTVIIRRVKSSDNFAWDSWKHCTSGGPQSGVGVGSCRWGACQAFSKICMAYMYVKVMRSSFFVNRGHTKETTLP